MYTVTEPSRMNETFARAFNSGQRDHLLRLYEGDAVLLADPASTALRGTTAIATALDGLLALEGTMTSRNNFCATWGDLALLRADYEIVDARGRAILGGSSAEVVRRQPDGSWRYVIDHALGASLPSVLRAPRG